MVLDVPGLVAELLQADQVIDRLPGYPGERHLADEMQEDDLAAFGHEEYVCDLGASGNNVPPEVKFPPNLWR